MRWICMVMHQTRWHILNRPIREVIVSDSQGNLKIIVFIIRLVFVGDTTEILRGRGSERGKFLRWKRCTKSFLSRGFKLQSNKHYCIFPINLHNQTNRNVPFIKINVRFFACTFHYCSNQRHRHWHHWAARSLDVKSKKPCTIKLTKM